MNENDGIFHRAVSKLLVEVFDGPPGEEAYILNPGDPGLLAELDRITAETASARPIPDKPSIAAHADHVHFGLSLLTRWLSGEENPWVGADWNASWERSRVSEDEWRTLCRDLREKSTVWQNAVAVRSEWDDLSAAGAISTVAHTAYHLGAIRQILAAAPDAG
jgi:hypothetical protein